jgi:hypothetical protein
VKTIQTRNDSLFSTCEPYLVAIEPHVEHLDLNPFGITTPGTNVVDPLRLSSEVFLTLLQTMDALTFGPEGMPMPRWVFLGGAELPGAIYGFARRVKDLPDEVNEKLKVPAGYDGLVPLSMYIAIPVAPPDVWFGHNLASLNPVFPALGLKGLASITKALALKCFRCKVQEGATQWDSDALHIHTRFGPLELVTAWTPQHSEPWTLTYRFSNTDEKMRFALGDPEGKVEYPEEEFHVVRSDIEAQQGLQRRLEAGERFVVTGRPRNHGMKMEVPLAKIG